MALEASVMNIPCVLVRTEDARGLLKVQGLVDYLPEGHAEHS